MNQHEPIDEEILVLAQSHARPPPFPAPLSLAGIQRGTEQTDCDKSSLHIRDYTFLILLDKTKADPRH
jgi:hypothetical protein